MNNASFVSYYLAEIKLCHIYIYTGIDQRKCCNVLHRQNNKISAIIKKTSAKIIIHFVTLRAMLGLEILEHDCVQPYNTYQSTCI